MVHFVIQWDLPDQKANLTIYANKAKNDWLPVTLSHKGVLEIRNYRNPLEVTPQVAITIDFETLDDWRDFVDSQDYIRIMRELRIGTVDHQQLISRVVAPLLLEARHSIDCRIVAQPVPHFVIPPPLLPHRHAVEDQFACQRTAIDSGAQDQHGFRAG